MLCTLATLQNIRTNKKFTATGEKSFKTTSVFILFFLMKITSSVHRVIKEKQIHAHAYGRIGDNEIRSITTARLIITIKKFRHINFQLQ